jgi:cytoskeleton protein RodZ
VSIKPDNVIVTEENLSPGSRLQKARDALGISQKSLADDLYLPLNYILWIEEGAYEKLPSMVFCRGYIRAYAKAVNEDGAELIALLDNIYGIQTSKGPLKSISKIDRQVKVSDPVMKWSTLLFILVLGAAVFWWWKTQYGLTSPLLSSQDPIAVETVNGNELVLPSLDAQNANVELSNAELGTNTQNPAGFASDNSGAQQQPTANQNANQGTSNVADTSTTLNNGTGIELQLNLSDETERNTAQLAELEQVVKTLEPTEADVVNTNTGAVNSTPASVDINLLAVSFNNECWVTIKDVRGKVLFNGIKKSGQKLSLTGDAPLSLSIGRVDSVSSITYGGVEIDLQSLSRNNIANFKLPL